MVTILLSSPNCPCGRGRHDSAIAILSTRLDAELQQNSGLTARQGPVTLRPACGSAPSIRLIDWPDRVPFTIDPFRVMESSRAIMEEIAKVVQDFILEEFLRGEDPQELTPRTPLITGGILDSISTLKLVVFLEERFGITVEAFEAGVEHLDSIGQIAELVAEKKKAA